MILSTLLLLFGFVSTAFEVNGVKTWLTKSAHKENYNRTVINCRSIDTWIL